MSEKANRVVALMQGSATRMSGLIDNLLDFARGRLGGGFVLDRNADQPLQTVLEQVVAELQVGSPDHIIETEFNLIEPIDCDRSRIAQMVSNLLGNALTHGSNAPRDRNRAALNPTSPLYFGTFLAECWKNGNRIGRHLFYDIKNRGYTGSRSNLARLLKVWREVENIQPDDPPPDVHVSEPVRDPDTGHVISSVVAAALCIKPRGLLTDLQTRKVNALKQGSTVFAIMRDLAMRFNGILRSRNSDSLDEWIDDAIDTELTAIMRFASVLRRDIDAVKNAIELPWSNGQAEGPINRLKMLKRAMYGRAGPELMRARMLPLNHRN
jgi:hypothetical protein